MRFRSSTRDIDKAFYTIPQLMLYLYSIGRMKNKGVAQHEAIKDGSQMSMNEDRFKFKSFQDEENEK